MIASPEMFLAAAGQVTHTIKLGTGVVSLPYHHPFNVAQRMVQLDHMTKGRAMFGSGPGALPSDARTMGISPMLLRDRQDEAMGIIIRLLNGEERFSYESDWFDTARRSAADPSDPGTHADGDRIEHQSQRHADWPASTESACCRSRRPAPRDLQALPTQWQFAEEAAQVHGTSGRPSRLASLDELAHRRDEGAGPTRGRARACIGGTTSTTSACSAGRARLTSTTHGICSIRCPRAVPKVVARQSSARRTTSSQAIEKMQEVTGGFGVVLGFAHDWANRENTLRSWDMVARYVIPALNGSVRPMQASADYVEANKAELIGGASAAVMSKIMAHEGAAAALATTMTQMAERQAARRAKAAEHEPENDPTFRPGAGLPSA